LNARVLLAAKTEAERFQPDFHADHDEEQEEPGY